MIVAEQATRSRYWTSNSAPSREIRLNARLEISGEPEADVETSLLFEPLASPWDEQIDQYLYDGVHAGLAIAGMPLPGDGIRVLITELRILPGLAPDSTEDEVRSVGETVHGLTAATVSALWIGLSQPATVATR